MNNKEETKSTIADQSANQHQPFVNEECGDTLWDAVLTEAEDRLRITVNQNRLILFRLQQFQKLNSTLSTYPMNAGCV